MLRKLITLILAVTFFVSCAPKTEIVNLECEHCNSPIGVGTANPLFSWSYSNVPENFKPVNPVVTVIDSEGNSCQITPSFGDGSDSVSLCYNGENALKSRERYKWYVTVRDASTGEEYSSEQSSFETSILENDAWLGNWISDGRDKTVQTAPVLRKTFTLAEDFSYARAYVSAAAYAWICINGTEICSTALNPGYAAYDKRNLCDTYDVSSLLKPGENVIFAVLGNGFFNDIDYVAVWEYENAAWRDRAALKFELDVYWEDGRKVVIGSDSSWKSLADQSRNPFVQNNIYSGDHFDARLWDPSMMKADYDDSEWYPAFNAEAPSARTVATLMPRIEVDKIVEPVGFKAVNDSCYLADFGVNMSGYTRLVVKGPRGTVVKVAHGEFLDSLGNFTQNNLICHFRPKPGHEFQTDFYTLSGDVDTLQPRFNYHGFRYALISSTEHIDMTAADIKAQFIHTTLEKAGSFACSDPALNGIRDICLQSYLSNVHGLPTDCCQREKNGWTADAYLGIDYGLLNYAGVNLYLKWIDDIVDCQLADGQICATIPTASWGYGFGPVWDAAIVYVPAALYRYCADMRGILTILPALERYIEYLGTREVEGGMIPYGLGDWLSYRTSTPFEYTSTCYYYDILRKAAWFETLAGRDGSAYSEKALLLKSYINDRWYDEATSRYAGGTQAAQALALNFDLVPDGQQEKVARVLSESIAALGDHLDYGTIGTKTVLWELTKYGYADQAYKMATQKTAPSYAYWLEMGLTTTPEVWVPSTRNCDSGNHPFFGDICAWMVKDVAGLGNDPEAPGYSRLIINPHFINGLDWAKAEYETPFGKAACSWKRACGRILLKVTVPPCCTAVVKVDGDRVLGPGTHKLSIKQTK